MTINFVIKSFTYIKHSVKKLLVLNKSSFQTSSEVCYITSKKLQTIMMPQSGANLEFEGLPTPVKSASDKKEYRVIRLKNGLTACLVSDTSSLEGNEENDNDEEKSESESDKSGSESEEESDEDDEEDTSVREQKMAAAALCVGVGSFSDPKDIPGMAHFLEHMVFMGSEKFPKENDFDSFISKRGGSDNASTDCEATTFYFECLEKDLFTALDKFAQFFISPLMNRGSITREREAIDSEFQMALPSDSNRKEQLIASFATSDSPVNSFTWGNLITLRDNVSEDELYKGVHEFRKRHYSAHRMTLAIQARLSLDELQSYVLECFSNVPTNDLPPEDFKKFSDVFCTSQFTKMYYVQPVNDIIQLDLTWALPSLLHKYKSKPHHYVSSLIGDEGKGSLLSYLKKKVWVLSITAGNSESGSEHSSMYCMFSITLTLTKEGLQHLDEVIEIIFSYINLLRHSGPEKRLYNEMKIIADTSFKFQSEETAIEFVEDLCEHMQIYPPEDYLTGSELYFEYDPNGIQMVLDNLVPNKVNIIVLCNNLPSGLTLDKTEKWFGTKYKEQDIPKDWLKRWEKSKPCKELALPLPNQFLTEDFSILDENENHPDYPEKILKTNIVELWYRKDQKFKLPIAYYNFYFINPLSLQTPKTVALLDCYMTLLQILIAEEAYPAVVAELSYGIRSFEKGLILSVSGYNEKLHTLIDLLVKHFTTFKSNLTEEMFIAVKDKLIRFYYNRLLKPNNLAKDVRLEILIDDHHSLLHKYNTVSSITFEDIKKFAEDFISKLFIKVLIQGNVTKEHSIDVVNNVIAILKCESLEPDTYPNFRVCQLPKGEHFCIVKSFNKADSNSIITNYYQSGPFSIEDCVMIQILMLIIEEPLFDTLRTKEQLGYDVRCSNRNTCGILGFSITVNAQATKNTTNYVEKRIEEFIKQASELLVNMKEEEFEATKKDLIKMKRCVDVELKEEFNRNWSEITDEDYMFDRLKQEIEAIGKIRLDETRKWWEDHSSIGNENKLRKLSVQVTGFDNNGHGNQIKEEPQDLESTKLSLSFIDYGTNEIDSNDETQYFIKNLTEFKEKLYLFPVISKYPI